MCYSLDSPLKILPCGYLTKKYISIPWEKKKKPYDRILRKKPKEQHLSIVLKSCPKSYNLQNIVKTISRRIKKFSGHLGHIFHHNSE